MIWVCLIFAALIAAPLILEATRKPMNEAARADAPGDFVQLSQGVTHYQWQGSPDGPVAVCIHGLTTPSFVWQGLTKGLAQMGFRVLVYDLYGRGYSDRPKGRQDRDFFLTQFDDLLTDQDIGDDITLIGYSMGGAIATVFAAAHPNRIRTLILLAPAGMVPVATGLLGFAARTPGVGTWLMLALYPRVLRRGLRAEKDTHSSVPGINTLQQAELDWGGFIPAVRASLGGLLAQNLHADHEALQQEDVPVLAIFGRADTVIPLTSRDRLKDWNSTAQTAVIDGAGHGLTYSHTPEILDHIGAFTRQSR